MPTSSMEAHRIDPETPGPARVDWESFYRNYRKPGYVPGFEIVNKLGGGMFGLVFKARKESIGKDYAIKFLKVDDDSVRDAVMREIDNVSFFAQIDHPNLVSIEDRGVIDGIPFLVMSYAGDQTLQHRLQQGRMVRDEALQIFAQAARGVQALHDHSLVHFDLKPANVFLKGDVARVGDYGLSKLVSASRNSLSFGRGTPYYMAPEMLQRRGDARSDVYSLGILLFECLYGDVPFRGDSEWEVLRKHETAQPEFPADARPGDVQVILRCLAKDPADRFQSAAELLRALQAPVALGESLVLGSGGSAPTATLIPPRAAAPNAPNAPNAPGAPSAAAAVEPPPMPGLATAVAPQEQFRANGLIAFFVRALFGLITTMVRLVLLPVRLVSLIGTRGFTWLFRFPVAVVGVVARLIGVVLVVSLIVLVMVTVLSLFASV